LKLFLIEKVKCFKVKFLGVLKYFWVLLDILGNFLIFLDHGSSWG